MLTPRKVKHRKVAQGAPSKPSVLNNFQHGETPSFPDPLSDFLCFTQDIVC